MNLQAERSILTLFVFFSVGAKARNFERLSGDPGCFEIDTDFQGYDLYLFPYQNIISPEKCNIKCEEDTLCEAWTWTPQKNCYLKNGKAFFGKRSLRYLQLEYLQHPNGFKQPGMQQETSKSNESDQSSEESLKQQTNQSAMSNFEKLYEQFIKPKITKNLIETNERKSLKGKVSGTKYCTNPSFLCYELFTDFKGYDLERIISHDIKTPLACHEMCSETPSCLYWTWDSKHNNCYLKSNDAPLGLVRNNETLHFISGPLLCGSCYEHGVDYFGYDVEKIETSRVVSAENCRHLCQRNRNCFYWTWVSQEQRCYLKNESAQEGREVSKRTQGMVSGAKSCPGHGVVPEPMNGTNNIAPQGNYFNDIVRHKPKSCYEYDVNFEGFDVAKFDQGDVSSSQMCQKFCRDDHQCFYWTWNMHNNHCFLKGYQAYTSRAQNQSTVGMISGPKFCPCPGF